MSARQKEATKRWMSKPGIREAQNEKARLRASRNRAKKKVLRSVSDEQFEPDLFTYDESEGGSPSDHRESESPGTPEDGSPGSLAYNIRVSRIAVVNWQIGWGGEHLWEKKFNDEVQAAREGGREAIDEYFRFLEAHAEDGRQILTDLKFAAEVSCNNTPDEIRDLFLQGYEMVLAVASEVKFCEVKLDEFAPAVPMSRLSDTRCYTTI